MLYPVTVFKRGRAGAKRLPPLMDAKKGKTRKQSTPIKVWVTPEEESVKESGVGRSEGTDLGIGPAIIPDPLGTEGRGYCPS